jgi:hypothetical protein
MVRTHNGRLLHRAGASDRRFVRITALANGVTAQSMKKWES